MAKKVLSADEKAAVGTHVLTVNYELKTRDLSDLLITAFEGGVRYWAEVRVPSNGPLWTAKLIDREGDDKTHVLSLDKLLTGLRTCAAKYPHHFKDFIAESGDMTTADVIVQCAVFGEIIYG